MDKKTLSLAFVFCGIALALVAVASIENSAHDFSDESWTTEICAPCHVPHNSEGSMGPLWAHTNTTESSFTMYDNTSGTQDSAKPTEPSGVSKMCLSCHDGSVAVDAFGGAAGSVMITDAAYTNMQVGAGGDLSSDHPISITYDNTLFVDDGGLHNPTNAAVADLLIANKVECSSCHDVHNGDGNSKLLRVDNTGSLLCLTCHDK